MEEGGRFERRKREKGSKMRQVKHRQADYRKKLEAFQGGEIREYRGLRENTGDGQNFSGEGKGGEGSLPGKDKVGK